MVSVKVFDVPVTVPEFASVEINAHPRTWDAVVDGVSALQRLPESMKPTVYNGSGVTRWFTRVGEGFESTVFIPSTVDQQTVDALRAELGIPHADDVEEVE